jgi:hypothetical protein
MSGLSTTVMSKRYPHGMVSPIPGAWVEVNIGVGIWVLVGVFAGVCVSVSDGVNVEAGGGVNAGVFGSAGVTVGLNVKPVLHAIEINTNTKIM